MFKYSNDGFFTRDRDFYTTLFRMLVYVAFQNIVAFSVNMADNIMLGRYSQDALAGAATVNQVFFLIQQFVLSVGNTLVALASQYWAKRNTKVIRSLTGISLKLGAGIGLCVLLACGIFTNALLRLFTDSPEIIAQGTIYLRWVMWSFELYIISGILMAALRAVGTVRISFYVSLISLLINVSINYVLIFGKLGLPSMGIQGAAIGTMTARATELAVILGYLFLKDRKIEIKKGGVFAAASDELRHDYQKMYIPMMYGHVFWAISVPVQTAILGHLSADAIAANSVASTFYQYLKVVVQAMAASAAVMIGNAIGKGDETRVRSDARTISVLSVGIGIVLGVTLILLRKQLLELYRLNAAAKELAIQLILLMGLIMMPMSYQMPVSSGIIQGAGDARFLMKMNLISVWCIVIPLSLAAAFWWKLPVILVVLCIQSDQVFKCIPTYLHFRKYGWIKKLTREMPK